MELTRRDAVAALAALGVGGAAVAGLDRSDWGASGDGDARAETVDADRIRETLLAAAEVVYPREVTGIEEFVGTFLEGRLEDPTHATALDETVAKVDELAEAWYGARFATLSTGGRESFLREVGADTADEDPDGTTAERVRYYVVNELLLALYASPTGGELVGIENPQGHPGGIDTYQRGPEP
ncbi:hypothetical protein CHINAEXTREME_07485 [Halobiforma lacisalsi AJ5]|uniref:Gluconate 2-dehydrogenase subunit 3 family protein n=1 Tax=Natronobacterium lacisalsi AJ5 TaxID=358396 RepID=M0LY31_NATLA|nr:gluconate 2-dehydrogenase subunit 3 family protein [Halobiforma lacisalsi]APW97623.1 hypothetical protein CHINAEXTREME_07485 [Halobiforma lacisalsi AJ5]EMA36990.1 hypothetical protein C445_02071 [Halobiforma lacisalsi AJ5]